MEKKKIEIIAVVVLLAIFMLLLVKTIGTAIIQGRKSPKVIGGTESNTQQPATSISVDDKTFLLQKERVGRLKWLKDPFAISAQFAPSNLSDITRPDQLRVTGIIFDRTNPKATYAIINDTVVKSGDKFGTLHIIDIKQNVVSVRLNGAEYALPLGEETGLDTTR